ncbi:unnamed protein product [Heligmosomoides polygyrus]|uniref:BLOC-1-related complex subunit 7 n=1 Tax=Heligmosomoides polygyrus TaxID=6339 RepID=A0A183FK00_HELPZ|nr:unnamed protein product [Heligmosomoides polygyrus]
MAPAAYSDPAVSSRGSQTATMLFIRAQNLMAHDQFPLQSLGQLIGSTKYGTNYERLVSDTMKGMRLDVHGLKQIQCSLSNLATSSDSVVRDLVGIVTFQCNVIVGIASALDHVLASLPVLLEVRSRHCHKRGRRCACRTRRASGSSRSNLLSRQLTCGSFSAHGNGTPPTMRASQGTRRPFSDIASARHAARERDKAIQLPLGRECGQEQETEGHSRGMPPVSEIKQYSCRLAGNVSRNRRLKDIPEAVAVTPANFLLDMIGLGSPNLDKTVDELRAAQHPWWINLGCNDSQREHQFRHRQNLGDALAEVDQWPCVNGELVERKRRPTLEDRPSRSTDSRHD